MARRRRRKGGRTAQQNRFAAAARACHAALRRGDLPRKGEFASCMSSEMRSRKR